VDPKTGNVHLTIPVVATNGKPGTENRGQTVDCTLELRQWNWRQFTICCKKLGTENKPNHDGAGW
jgi:hypothetical protein